MAQDSLELHSLSDQDIEAQIAENKLRLKKLKFSHAVSPIENPLTIKLLKKETARLRTEQRKRVLNPSAE